MSALKPIYPAVGFYFQLIVDNETYSFNEVSGISSEVTTKEIVEGDENRFKYEIPTNVNYNNLELKRGLVPEDSNLILWLNNSFQQGSSNPIKAKTVEICLLDEAENIVMWWIFMRALPVAYNFATLESMNKEILIESLSLSYTYFTRKL